MDSEVLSDLLEDVKEMARYAGAAIEEVRARGTEVESKEDGSPVTEADMAAHRVLVSGLDECQPQYPVVSEEGEFEESGSDFPSVHWLVDPLDGTKEFVKGLPEYTVNVALIEEGESVLGVIYIPAADTLYYAAHGLGAWKVDDSASPERLNATPQESAFTAAISRSHASQEIQDLLDRWRVQELVRRGSSLKMCAVAEGTAHVYPRLGPTYLWDTAAGTAIVREAGGQVTDLNGQPLTYKLQDGWKKYGFFVTSVNKSAETLAGQIEV